MIVDAKFESEELINRVLRELYAPTFSRFSDEYQEPESYRDALKSSDTNPEVHMLVHNPEDPSAFLIFEIYERSKSALISYAMVKDSERGKGINRKLFRETFRILEDRGIFDCYGEIHNPTLSDKSQDLMDPGDRLSIFKRLGGRVVPINYVQPPLSPGSDYSKNFLLVKFNSESNRERLYEFLYDFYQCLRIERPEEDENFLSMFLEDSK